MSRVYLPELTLRTSSGGQSGYTYLGEASKKKLFFFTFCQIGRGGLGEYKKSLSEKTEAVKKGPGGGLNFLTKSKKKKKFYFDAPPKILMLAGKLIFSEKV